MTARRTTAFLLVVATATVASAGCGAHANGEFRAKGDKLGEWTLVPNTCGSGMHQGVFGADLYRIDPGQDTELVLLEENGAPLVLARVPGKGRMVRFVAGDCKRFEPKLDFNGTRVNRIPGLSGSLALECDVPGVGQLSGAATFDCY